jgi:hypothetical protein
VAELDLPFVEPGELASAYTDIFLLNVYPYGTAFTDLDGELNGPDAQRIAALYEAHGYRPVELTQVGAPDHVGLGLGFMGQVGEQILGIGDWGPVCCLAVERDPSAHLFYRALAARTREWLMANGEWRMANSRWQIDPPPAIGYLPSTEIGLHDIVRFFLAPARCGVFLSRSRLGHMAKSLGMRLPFGSRFDVADALFRAAGDDGRVADLLRALNAEIEQWAAAYRAWGSAYPTWEPFAARWLGRIDTARWMLEAMRQVLDRPPELEADDAALAVRLS